VTESSSSGKDYSAVLEIISLAVTLVLDDWGVTPLTDASRRDLLEILDDRYDRKSTLVTSQLPVDRWHESLADPTLADAILDRLVHNAHRLELSGESIRRVKAEALVRNVTNSEGESHVPAA
jgi:DNA replication protein DnaC